MTLLYRAVWNDDRPDLMVAARTHFVHWLASKDLKIEVPHEGEITAESRDGTVEVSARRANADGVEALQLELVEERPTVGQRWTTALRVLTDPDGRQWVWVDLSQVADDFTARRTVAAPRLVRDLIGSGVDARVDQVRLTPEPVAMAASSIGGLVRNQDRTLPIVVFSHDSAFDEATTLERARTTLRSLQGAIQVFVLPTSQESALRDALGDDLAVWGGAARLYLPNRDARGLRPDRHRYVLPGRMERHPTVAARIFAGMLMSVVTARRPPASFEAVRRQLRGGGAGDHDLIVYADQEIDRLRSERDDLRLQLALLDEEIFDARADLLASEEEITHLQQQLQAAWANRASSPGSPAEPVAELAAAGSEVAAPVSAGAAIERARSELSNLVIHPDAGKDLEDIDGHDNGPAWASKIWRGLQALDAYAGADYDGNFKAWCMNSRDPLVWPATDKKLAMRESETVESNERYRKQRNLPISTAVDPSGFVVMWSHLKISEGGGRLAPRVYFHDDTRGSTGKVHVGFIGPHHFMENTKTN